MSRIDRRYSLFLLAIAASLVVSARAPEKASRPAPLEVTYYFLPG